MAMRMVPNEQQSSVAIEILLEKALPDYNLEEIEQPTPRDVDGMLATQGFRNLLDDARGVLTELLQGTPLEITQLTGAICPGDEDVYKPGLWIVLADRGPKTMGAFDAVYREQITGIAQELIRRLKLD